MIVNLTTFADLAGVGKPCVTLSVQRGKLVTNSAGFIDTTDPINSAYLQKRKNKLEGKKTPNDKKAPEQRMATKDKPCKTKPLKKTATPKPAKKATTKLEHLDGVEMSIPDTDLDDDGEKIDEPLDQLDKLAADVRLKNAQAKRHELKFEQDKGNVVKVEIVERMASKINNEIKTRLQDLPRRVTPRIMAMARSVSDDKEVQLALEREIDDSLEAISVALGASLV